MEYRRFLQYPSLDAGSVIKYILQQSGITRRQLALISGLPPQRISDFANNNRRITAEASLKLENALNIDYQGYFYIIQANHDVYLAKNLCKTGNIPDLAKIKKHIFWDSDMDRIEWQSNARHIIQRIFEYGDETAIEEIIRFYGKTRVKSELSQISESRLAERRNQNASKYL